MGKMFSERKQETHSPLETSIGYRWAVVLAEPLELVPNPTTHLLPWQPEEGLLSLTPAGHFSCFNVNRQLAGINLCVVKKKSPQTDLIQKNRKEAIFLIYVGSPIHPRTPPTPHHNSPVVFENFQPFQVISLLK